MIFNAYDQRHMGNQSLTIKKKGIQEKEIQEKGRQNVQHEKETDMRKKQDQTTSMCEDGLQLPRDTRFIEAQSAYEVFLSLNDERRRMYTDYHTQNLKNMSVFKIHHEDMFKMECSVRRIKKQIVELYLEVFLCDDIAHMIMDYKPFPFNMGEVL